MIKLGEVLQVNACESSLKKTLKSNTRVIRGEVINSDDDNKRTWSEQL